MTSPSQLQLPLWWWRRGRSITLVYTNGETQIVPTQHEFLLLSCLLAAFVCPVLTTYASDPAPFTYDRCVQSYTVHQLMSTQAYHVLVLTSNNGWLRNESSVPETKMLHHPMEGLLMNRLSFAAVLAFGEESCWTISDIMLYLMGMCLVTSTEEYPDHKFIASSG